VVERSQRKLGESLWSRAGAINILRLAPSTWAVIALVGVVAYLIGTPLFGLLLGSITDTPPGVSPHFTLSSLAYAYGEYEHFISLRNSIAFAGLTATLVLILGGGLAWAAARTDSMVRHFVDLFALAPILIPSVVFVSGWILLLGPKNGFLNLLLMQYFGVQNPPFNVYSFWGMIWVATLQELPLAFLWLWPAFRAMNPDLEEAALMVGASPGMIMRRISLPLLRPALLSAWIIFFIYSIGALMVPLMIGLPSRIILYSTEIYLAAHRVPSDLNLASAYSLLVLITSFLGIYAYRRSVHDTARFATVTGKAFNPRVTLLGRWRTPVTAFAVLILLLAAGLPILVLVWNAFMPFPQAPSARSLELATLANFRAALAYGPAVRALVNSVWLGFASGLIATMLGVLIAWSTVRLRRPRWALAALDQLSTLPIAMPGMIIGVSLLWFYLMVPLPIYGTGALFLIAYVTLHLPYAVRICASGILQLHQELEEMGRVAGASWMVVFRRIVLGLMAPSLLASLLYVALRSFREYAASIFLAAPGTEVFSVLVLDMWDTGNFSTLSAYVTMVVALLGTIVVVFGWLMRRLGGQMTRTS
jgi:iron(III) transport system permease protein